MSPSLDARYGHRPVWRIATPMILTNVTVPLLGVVDTAVVGHLDSPHYLGAVAVGATIFSFLFMGLNFLRMGTTGLTAQALGAGDNDGLRRVLGQAVILALLMSALLIALQAPIGRIALLLIQPGPDVVSQAQLYFSVRIWAAPAVLCNFALVGWFLGMQMSRAALTVVVLINVVNIGLDLLFVAVWGMKADGVALASVIAEFCGLCAALAIARRVLARRAGRWPGETFLKPRAYREMFSVNSNLLVRSLALMSAFGFMTAQGARMGDAILAANAVLMNFLYLMAYGLDGLANAAEALVGKAKGSGNRPGMRRAIQVVMIWSAGVAGVFSLLYLLAGQALIGVISDIETVRSAANRYLPWLIVSPLVSFWSFAYDGIFVGATMAREMRNTMLAATFLVFIPVALLLQPWDNHGLWFALMIFMATRGLTMYWIARRRGLHGATDRN